MRRDPIPAWPTLSFLIHAARRARRIIDGATDKHVGTFAVSRHGRRRIRAMNPTAVDEEDFRDFPSLPSHLNTTGFLTTAGRRLIFSAGCTIDSGVFLGGGSTLRSESEGMQAQV